MSHPSTLKILRDQAPALSVGMMTADLMSLGSELSLLEAAGAAIVHIDVMDGVFCPPMTAGPPLIRAMKTPLLKDVHLMIAEPLDKIAEYVAAGADIITIHPEACAHPHRALQQMRGMVNANDAGRGLVRGVALNPGTPLNVLEPLLDEAELVLLLAVNPGWRGQSFIPATFSRITKVKKMIREAGKDILVGVDGGITRQNVAGISSQTGVDIVVAGSAVFDGKAPKENVQMMLSALRATHD